MQVYVECYKGDKTSYKATQLLLEKYTICKRHFHSLTLRQLPLKLSNL